MIEFRRAWNRHIKNGATEWDRTDDNEYEGNASAVNNAVRLFVEAYPYEVTKIVVTDRDEDKLFIRPLPGAEFISVDQYTEVVEATPGQAWAEVLKRFAPKQESWEPVPGYGLIYGARPDSVVIDEPMPEPVRAPQWEYRYLSFAGGLLSDFGVSEPAPAAVVEALDAGRLFAQLQGARGVYYRRPA